ncbi:MULTISPECIES: acyl-[acyl-carrier-protein] thioesterase [Aerococcus]|uniref:Acyl-ACP thioesterase n=2 Tax=Lactobacillales TaxID=186826 RepID=A0A5N1GL45_9LACT|nr:MULTISPECIES: acyl-ACP thioesterase domain-containing protein [Aerococcus]KAA9301693.1 hypothetical protein F6I03_00345 [Aerococcus sanguinicola]MDK6368894.1 thioesterase [Aerococcus sp. UMB9870]MDK6687293.1 thioesterase [Aerococcus sp. UMB8623]MDK6940390.1 thioesterase [Aerococcus sp. UMB8487]OFK19571.1 hypothetical protein HMPREF2829_00300 [Aerococcus sp. HMSC072A12]
MAAYSKEFILTELFCDANGEVTMKGIVDLVFQLVANQEYDWPYEHKLRGYNWIVLSHHFACQSRPRLGDKVRLETGIIEVNRFFVYRYYHFYNSDGQVVIKGQSQFSLMDLEARKIVRIPDQFQAENSGLKAERPYRFKKNLGEPDLSSEARVQYTEIDANQHVNNSVYLNWVINQVAGTFLASRAVQAFDISYDHELGLGQAYQLASRIEEQEDSAQTWHQVLSGETSCARIHVDWLSRDGN